MSQTQDSELKNLHDAFIAADKDGDELLNNSEFTHFVEIAYRKKCPPQMYPTICTRFNCDKAKGINWNTAKTIYLQANNSSQTAKSKRHPKEPSHSKTNSSSDSSQYIRKHSITMSQSSVTSEQDRELIGSDMKHRIKRASTLSSSGFHGKRSFDNVNDTSSMIVDILDTKNKSLQNKLIKERTKRKKTEEIAQSLLKQNEEQKRQIETLQNTSSTVSSLNKRLNDKVSTLQRIVDDDRNTIKYLKEEHNSMKSELDETYVVWSKQQNEHGLMIKKLKQKHKHEMEKLCAGFMESLGIEKGTDITSVIKTLKTSNLELKNTVDTLSESLARKQQSLLEALQAVDNIARQDEKTQYELEKYKQMNEEPMVNKKERKILTKLKQWKQRRKSIGFSRRLSGSFHAIRHRSKSSSGAVDNEFMGVKEMNDDMKLNATFFRNVNAKDNDDDELNIDNAKNTKEMEFLSLKLTEDVANKTQSIQNLEMANTVLFEQMEKLKQQMDAMKHKKSKYDEEMDKKMKNINEPGV